MEERHLEYSGPKGKAIQLTHLYYDFELLKKVTSVDCSILLNTINYIKQQTTMMTSNNPFSEISVCTLYVCISMLVT